MSNSLALYRPSILELAREGNFRAIAFWINSLLGPYGIYIRVMPSKSGTLNILVDFKQSRRREFYLALRKQLVRFICYRLWTLNSDKIRDIRIIARVAGEQEILWKQSIRLVTPANRESVRDANRLRDLTRKGAAWLRFQMLRSAMMSRLAFATFFLCYWLMYWEGAGQYAADQSLAAMASSAIAVEQPVPSSEKGQLRAGNPSDAVRESSIALLGQNVQQELVQKTVAEEFSGKLVYQAKLPEGEKVVALTFDDGPWETTTEQVLDILKQNDIKATFFWVGQALQTNPDIARKVAAAGHAIGNHTWRHPMDNVDEVTAAAEIGNTARLIYETTGLHTNLFRPPGGNLDGSMVPYAKGQKNVITMWSAESDDYLVSAPIIVDNVLSRVQPGGIVLMHDGGGDRSQTVQALPQIIAALKQQGYRFVTVPELLAQQAKEETIVQPPAAKPTDPAPFNPATDSNNPASSPNPVAPASPTPAPNAVTPDIPTDPTVSPPVDLPVAPGGDALNSPPANPTAPPSGVPTFDSPPPDTGVNFPAQPAAPNAAPVPTDPTGNLQPNPDDPTNLPTGDSESPDGVADARSGLSAGVV